MTRQLRAPLYGITARQSATRTGTPVSPLAIYTEMKTVPCFMEHIIMSGTTAIVQAKWDMCAKEMLVITFAQHLSNLLNLYVCPRIFCGHGSLLHNMSDAPRTLLLLIKLVLRLLLSLILLFVLILLLFFSLLMLMYNCVRSWTL